MIFYFEQPQLVEMWMRDTLIPLDIIFINEDQEVIAVEQGQPEDDTLLSHEDTMYVVEVNVNSGVQEGDSLEFVEDEDVVKSLINMGVDNIIANDPPMVKDVVNNYKNKNKTNVLLNFLIYLYERDPEYVNAPD